MKFSEYEETARAIRVKIEGAWVCVALKDGREIRFPVSKNRRLCKATSKEVRNVEIICNGTGLHWPDLDEDLSVQGVLEGRVGQPELVLEEAVAR